MFYNCKEATLAAAKGQEEQLSGKEKFFLRVHLLYCKLCRRFVKQTEFLKRSLLDFEQKNENGEHLVQFSEEKKNAITISIGDELKKEL